MYQNNQIIFSKEDIQAVYILMNLKSSNIVNLKTPTNYILHYIKSIADKYNNHIYMYLYSNFKKIISIHHLFVRKLLCQNLTVDIFVNKLILYLFYL